MKRYRLLCDDAKKVVAELEALTGEGWELVPGSISTDTVVVQGANALAVPNMSAICMIACVLVRDEAGEKA